jgi:hypothetical protein
MEAAGIEPRKVPSASRHNKSTRTLTRFADPFPQGPASRRTIAPRRCSCVHDRSARTGSRLLRWGPPAWRLHPPSGRERQWAGRGRGRIRELFPALRGRTCRQRRRWIRLASNRGALELRVPESPRRASVRCKGRSLRPLAGVSTPLGRNEAGQRRDMAGRVAPQ